MSNDAPDLSTRRRAPKPPSNFGEDSAEVAPPAPVQRPTPEAKPLVAVEGDDDPVVQLNTRIRNSYKKKLSRLKLTEGQTIRSLIENAIDTAYPDA